MQLHGTWPKEQGGLLLFSMLWDRVLPAQEEEQPPSCLDKDQKSFAAIDAAACWRFYDFDLLFGVIDIDKSGSVDFDFNEFVAFFAKCDKERSNSW